MPGPLYSSIMLNIQDLKNKLLAILSLSQQAILYTGCLHLTMPAIEGIRPMRERVMRRKRIVWRIREGVMRWVWESIVRWLRERIMRKSIMREAVMRKRVMRQ